MRLLTTASLLAFANTVLAASWLHLGDDLAFVGPVFNGTFKAGDTIPLEYTFYNAKTVANANSTAPANSTAIATLVSLSWIGNTGSAVLDVALDNGRTSGFSAPCVPTDVCRGTYYPKRINMVIPAETYPSNYTVILAYTLPLTGAKKLEYKLAVKVVPASTNVTSPQAIMTSAPAVTVTLPVFAAPSSGLATQVPRLVLGAAVLISTVLLL